VSKLKTEGLSNSEIEKDPRMLGLDNKMEMLQSLNINSIKEEIDVIDKD
jgi:hypothetical protein